MRTGTPWLGRNNIVLPLGVLGGTAILATALVWSRRSSRENPPRVATGEGTPLPLELDDLEAEEFAGLDAKEFERRLEADGPESNLDELESTLEADELESGLEPGEVDVELDALDVAANADSLAGEAYDSVNPDDAAREWLLRATETQAPRRDDPDMFTEFEAAASQQDAMADEPTQPTVAIPPGFFKAPPEPSKS
jgi:hypothetical protein